MLSTTSCSCRARLSAGRCVPMHAARKRLHVTCFVNNKQQQQAGGKVIVGRKPSGPPALIKEEQQSLQAALKAAGLPADANAADLPKDAVRDVLSTIRKGLDKKEEDLPKLEGAMLLAEQLFHATRGNMMAAAGVQEAEPQAVDVWQPIFASAGGFPRLLYIPVPEFFDMHRALPDATAISISSVNDSIDASSNLDRAAAAAGPGGQINIITEMGPVVTHFLGSCSWLDANTFEYKINTVRLDLGGRSFSFGMGPFKLENELSFFLATPEVACARSKLGGTMLLAAEPAKGKAYFNAW